MLNHIERTLAEDGKSCLCIVVGGHQILFDEVDLDVVRPYRWTVGTHGYATSGAGKEQLLLHRLLMAPFEKTCVDHINHNKLDNRRLNLRVCSSTYNAFNKSAQSNNQCGYRGVCQLKNGRWNVQINKDHKAISLGSYSTPEEAANAYDSAAAILAGEFAWRNLPDILLRPNIFEELKAIRRKGQMSNEEIAEIRFLLSQGLTQKEVSERVGRSVASVRRVQNDPEYQRKTWRRNWKTHDEKTKVSKRHPRWLPTAKVKEVRELIECGYHNCDIAWAVGCSVSAVQRIKSGEVYKNER